MDRKEIIKHVDHTLLEQTATWEEIRQICDDAISYGTASVCIPPSYVKQVKEYVQDRIAVCTVIGFPNGYMTTKTKAFETKDALENGADEIDMVINLGWVKDKKYDCIEDEIRILKKECGEKILKVIIETCLLTEEEKNEVKEQIQTFKKYYHLTHEGEYYRLTNPFENQLFAAWEYVSPDQKEALIHGVQLQAQPNSPSQHIPVRGLNPDKMYEINGEMVKSGRAIMYGGLNLPRQLGDCMAVEFYLKEV